jgi:protein pelota
LAKAEIAAIVMQEGLAHVCLIKSALTKVCAKIERTMPKKKEVNSVILEDLIITNLRITVYRAWQGNKSYAVAYGKFLDDIYNAMKKYINFEYVKVVLVGR